MKEELVMKIIVDAMGGDNAPQAIVQGALDRPTGSWAWTSCWWAGRKRC
jgi:hypothetical protein